VTDAEEPEPKGSLEAPKYRTGALWIVLCILLVFGTVASGGVVYGVTGLFLGVPLWIDVLAIVVGAFVAIFSMLLLTGILYRVDRLRGVPHREVRLFE
jgi:hypothetical protein